MKNNHTHLTRLAAISLCLIMCLSSLAVLAPSASAAAEAVQVSNDRVGERIVFEQDYSSMYHIPKNVVLANFLSPYELKNNSMSYNYSDPSITLFTTPDETGGILVGGLSMAPIVNRTYDIMFTREEPSGTMNGVTISDRDLQVRLYIPTANPGYDNSLSVFSSWGEGLNKVTTLSGEQFTKYSDHARVNLTIQIDHIRGQSSIYIDGVFVHTTPLKNMNIANQLTSPYSWIDNQVVSGWVSTNIYSITETVPEYSHISPIPNPRITSFGLDGPHAPDKIERGVELLRNHGGVGTLWVDVSCISRDYSGENMFLLRDMLADGWELGIHFSEELEDLPIEDAIELMNNEYEYISQLFGVAPTSWCSQANKDNVTHAIYAYENLGMIWRTGNDGVNDLPNMGSLNDDTWMRHEITSRAGIVAPTYAHRTDEDPAVAYSISYSKFEQWLENYDAAGVQIVGYYKLWSTAMNVYHSEISDIYLEDGTSLSFTIDNIGGRSRLFVAAPFAEIVVDGDGNKVPFEAVDDGIIIEVEAGEYQVMTMSAYREDQIDRAISPLYAIIPVVVVLAVLGGLFTMIGRIKF